jgi:hypothetical protein
MASGDLIRGNCILLSFISGSSLPIALIKRLLLKCEGSKQHHENRPLSIFFDGFIMLPAQGRDASNIKNQLSWD